MLLIPGFMADDTLFDAMDAALAPFGPLVKTDLGRGATIEEMTQAILADAPARFICVGFSMGGYVAREIARTAPERVEKLILIATSARGDTEEMIRQRQSALKSPPERFKGLSRFAIQSSIHPDSRDDAALYARIRDMGVRLGGEVFHRQSLITRGGDLDRLSDIKLPTLIVEASHDGLRSPAEATELHLGIAGSDLARVEDTGHMIPLEKPDELVAVMVDWLRG
jgi:pimeloyl-ACP methyl ester carboxylesterase